MIPISDRVSFPSGEDRLADLNHTSLLGFGAELHRAQG
jgi:hypothetical protein